MENMNDVYTISLATAHPAKFAHAVDLALKGQDGYAFEDVLPEVFKGLEGLERRVIGIGGEDLLGQVRKLIEREVPASGTSGEAINGLGE